MQRAFLVLLFRLNAGALSNAVIYQRDAILFVTVVPVHPMAVAVVHHLHLHSRLQRVTMYAPLQLSVSVYTVLKCLTMLQTEFTNSRESEIAYKLLMTIFRLTVKRN